MEPPGRAGTGPRIQYAKTSDGVSIAFLTVGEGPALLEVPYGIGLIDQALRLPQARAYRELLSRNGMFVCYDGRGTGLSDREARDFSLDARMQDLEAVADRLGLERFSLFALGFAGPAAIAYAASRPERVSHLILWCSWAGGAPRSRVLSDLPWVQPVLDLIDRDWALYTETYAHQMVGWSETQLAHDTAAVFRASMSPEAVKAVIRTFLEDDVSHLLQLVRASTLVFHRRDGIMPLDFSQSLVTGIPNARMLVLEGSSLSPAVGDVAEVVAAIDEFLGEGEPSASSAAPREASAFRTVLFTDLVGHTEMMSRLGDERGRAVLREHERITRQVLKAHGGTEVKTMGDGFMASFGSVTKAVECGIALQRAVDARNMELGTGNMGERLEVRCGLNAGEPIEEDGDLFGATVILAARIAAKAEGGEILVANAVRELCSGKGFLFSDRGEFVAKGFEDPVRVYEVRWREAMEPRMR